jgi:hypothetical protein
MMIEELDYSAPFVVIVGIPLSGAPEIPQHPFGFIVIHHRIFADEASSKRLDRLFGASEHGSFVAMPILRWKRVG